MENEDKSKNYNSSSVTVIGKVLKCGKPKVYKNKTTGKETTKFFLEIETSKHGNLKVMVSTELDKNSDNYRERPFVGDTVRVESWKINNGWVNTTYNRGYEIISHDGRENWLNQKLGQSKNEREIFNKIQQYKEKIENENKDDFKEEIIDILNLESDTSCFQVSLIADEIEIIYEKGMINNDINAWVLDKGLKIGLWTFDNDKYIVTNDAPNKFDKILKVKKKYEKREISVKGFMIGYKQAMTSSVDENKIINDIDVEKYNVEQKFLKNFKRNIEAGIKAGIKDKEGMKKNGNK